MTMYDFSSCKTPDALFIHVTNALAIAREQGDSETAAAILSCFDEDARKVLIIGAGCLGCMMQGSEYRAAMMKALSETLYKEFRQEAKP